QSPAVRAPSLAPVRADRRPTHQAPRSRRSTASREGLLERCCRKPEVYATSAASGLSLDSRLSGKVQSKKRLAEQGLGQRRIGAEVKMGVGGPEVAADDALRPPLAATVHQLCPIIEPAERLQPRIMKLVPPRQRVRGPEWRCPRCPQRHIPQRRSP